MVMYVKCECIVKSSHPNCVKFHQHRFIYLGDDALTRSMYVLMDKQADSYIPSFNFVCKGIIIVERISSVMCFL